MQDAQGQYKPETVPLLVCAAILHLITCLSNSGWRRDTLRLFHAASDALPKAHQKGTKSR
jgi:hypothetical protein